MVTTSPHTSLGCEQLYRVNDAVTTLLAAEFGWVTDTESDDDALNNLVHEIAGSMERFIASRASSAADVVSVSGLATQLRHSDNEFATARARNDAIRVRYMRSTLAEAFPQHTIAVFARSLDENSPKLLQLLTEVEGENDIDFSSMSKLETEFFIESLSDEQRQALNEAEIATEQFTDDARFWAALEQYPQDYEKTHRDWVEFDLPLAGNTPVNPTTACPSDATARRDEDSFCSAHECSSTDFASHLADQN